jgi:hypothetical protein
MLHTLSHGALMCISVVMVFIWNAYAFAAKEAITISHDAFSAAERCARVINPARTQTSWLTSRKLSSPTSQSGTAE